jgi:hypothetical protein
MAGSGRGSLLQAIRRSRGGGGEDLGQQVGGNEGVRRGPVRWRGQRRVEGEAAPFAQALVGMAGRARPDAQAAM